MALKNWIFLKVDFRKLFFSKLIVRFNCENNHNALRTSSTSCPLRLFWLILTVLSFILCALLIAPIFSKWRNSPTYTSINTTNYPVWGMAFPGVTICSNMLIKHNQLKAALKRDKWKAVREKLEIADDEAGLEKFQETVATALQAFSSYSSSEDTYIQLEDHPKKIIDEHREDLTVLLRSVSGSFCQQLIVALKSACDTFLKKNCKHCGVVPVEKLLFLLAGAPKLIVGRI